MLAELVIDDLVLIARARLELSPGLNVITGETGAGKTLLAQAVGLLLGQRGGEELIRPGAPRALVQALFESGGTSLAVARELRRGGRSRALMDGLLSSAAAVEETLRARLAFYGQLEHTRLLQLERQLDLLDGFAAAELGPLADEYTRAYRRALDLVRALAELRAAGQDRVREIDMLRYQIDEIEAAAVEPGEDVRLAQERERARHAGKLLERVGGALALLAGEGEGAALDGLRVAQRLVGDAAVADAGLEPLAARLDALTAEADDLAAALRAYVESLDVDPAHRDAVEVRYDKLKALMRKYGASADEVLAYAAAARERLAVLETSEADEEQLAAETAAAQEAALAAAQRLGEARRRVAPRFAARVAAELKDLAMPHAIFEVRLTPRGQGADGPGGSPSADARPVAAGPPSGATGTHEGDDLARRFAALGPRGADEVEFNFSANPGVPPRPLRDTASGGELSRVMLAIRGMVTLGDDVETLVFDEVDAGIGGVTAAALGERLARLAGQRQIVCITHLPQVAAHADRQFAIAKRTDPEAGVTETVVAQVDGEERLAELCRMLGAEPGDEAARQHAQGLLERAARARC